MRGCEMTIIKQNNITIVDTVAVLFSLIALYHYFFTADQLATLYTTAAALFFCGVGFIVDAIDKVKVINITTNETTLLTSGKAKIQE
jgi:hypothetical protein